MCAICGCLSVIYVERQRKIGHKDKHGISTVINSASAHQKFHQLQQKEGETVLQFVTGLRKDGKDCNFDADFDNQIRDLVWCRCKSDFVKHKLFEERQQLTLTWMLELLEQCERAEHQISYLSVSKLRVQKIQTGFMKTLADLMVNKRVKETNKINIAIVVGPVGTWVEIQNALLEVRLVGSV